MIFCQPVQKVDPGGVGQVVIQHICQAVNAIGLLCIKRDA